MQVGDTFLLYINSFIGGYVQLRSEEDMFMTNLRYSLMLTKQIKRQRVGLNALYFVPVFCF